MYCYILNVNTVNTNILTHFFAQSTEDIFGDMEEDKEDEDGSSRSKRMKVDESSVSTELNWYYKTEGVTHGPLSSSEMFKMQTERYLPLFCPDHVHSLFW